MKYWVNRNSVRLCMDLGIRSDKEDHDVSSRVLYKDNDKSQINETYGFGRNIQNVYESWCVILSFLS